MSMSIGSSTTSNPFAYLQALWQQGQSQSGATVQANPLTELLTTSGAQGAANPSTADASTGAPSTSGNVFPQFSPQMLQALLALQTSGNGSSTQSLWSQPNADGSTGAGAAITGQQVQQTQHGRQGHHHHHDMGAGEGGGSQSGQSPINLLESAASGGTSQTTANANGSSTTTITYADGSTVTMTTAAPSNNSGSSSGSSQSGGGTNVVSNNLIEQLIQMQAQLMNTTQSVATA
jgi:hypothetical protein